MGAEAGGKAVAARPRGGCASLGTRAPSSALSHGKTGVAGTASVASPVTGAARRASISPVAGSRPSLGGRRGLVTGDITPSAVVAGPTASVGLPALEKAGPRRKGLTPSHGAVGRTAT